jgi:hypothetical protein
MVASAVLARAVVSIFVFTRAVIAASSKKMQAQAFETLLVAREP